MTSQQERQGSVLILDSDRGRAADFERNLGFLNYDAVSHDKIPEAVGGTEPLAIVVGELNPELQEAARIIRSKNNNIPFICYPESIDSQVTVSGGHTWQLELPIRRSQLHRLLQRAGRFQGRDRRHRITGTSASIRRVRELIEQVADFDTNVLITGESGTGKELVARTVHDLSKRADKPFVPINCGAIPADLLESELFGHKKGAFTGAIASRVGRFELAEGGTLFLDEIGDMSVDMQVKLLRVLQERVFERVGSGKAQSCDVRIIAATHKNLPDAVTSGDFREDLFYRLNVFPIEMPPLFKRGSDLPLLLNELLITHTQNEDPELRVSAAALRVLANYRWPGNIRELSNLVERLAIVKPVGTIEIADLPAKYSSDCEAPEIEPNVVSEAIQLTEASLKDHLKNVEKDLIQQAMLAANGVVAQAANLLSMRRTTLVEKIRKYEVTS